MRLRICTSTRRATHAHKTRRAPVQQPWKGAFTKKRAITTLWRRFLTETVCFQSIAGCVKWSTVRKRASTTRPDRARVTTTAILFTRMLWVYAVERVKRMWTAMTFAITVPSSSTHWILRTKTRFGPIHAEQRVSFWTTAEIAIPYPPVHITRTRTAIRVRQEPWDARCPTAIATAMETISIHVESAAAKNRQRASIATGRASMRTPTRCATSGSVRVYRCSKMQLRRKGQC